VAFIYNWLSSITSLHHLLTFKFIGLHQSVAFISQLIFIKSTTFITYWPSSVNNFHQLMTFIYILFIIRQQPSSFSSLRLSAAFVIQQPLSIGSLHHSVVFVYQQPLSFSSLYKLVAFVIQRPTSISSLCYLATFISWQPSSFSSLRQLAAFVSWQPLSISSLLVSSPHRQSTFSSHQTFKPTNTKMFSYFLQVVLFKFFRFL
jgi:hypothetical protein